MTGNTPTVLLGLAAIALTLPIGLLVLFLGYRGIERAHPCDVERPADRAAQLPHHEAPAQVPGQRGASTHEGRSEDTGPRVGGRASSV